MKFIASLAVKHSKHGNRSIVHRVAVAHIDKLSFHPDDVVLDVGCGTGDETVIIAANVKKVIGKYFHCIFTLLMSLRKAPQEKSKITGSQSAPPCNP